MNSDHLDCYQLPKQGWGLPDHPQGDFMADTLTAEEFAEKQYASFKHHLNDLLKTMVEETYEK